MDLTSGEELSYQFWEAHTNFPALLTTTTTRIGSNPTSHALATFDPLPPSLAPDKAILLPFVTFLPYFSKTLKNPTLPASALNDFITHRLPAFLRLDERGCLIALRFVKQAKYVHAVQTEVVLKASSFLWRRPEGAQHRVARRVRALRDRRLR